MPELQDLNIVFIGGQPKISQLDLADFEFFGAQIEERIRLPIAIQLTAGPFRLEMLPERSLIGLKGDADDDQRAALIKNAEVLLKDYLGRRSVTAVGLNFVFSLAPDLNGQLSRTLLDANVVGAIFDEPADVSARVSLVIPSIVEGSTLTCGLNSADDMVLKADFNYHFALGSQNMPSSVGVLGLHDAVHEHASVLASRIAVALGIL